MWWALPRPASYSAYAHDLIFAAIAVFLLVLVTLSVYDCLCFESPFAARDFSSFPCTMACVIVDVQLQQRERRAHVRQQGSADGDIARPMGLRRVRLPAPPGCRRPHALTSPSLAHHNMLASCHRTCFMSVMRVCPKHNLVFDVRFVAGLW